MPRARDGALTPADVSENLRHLIHNGTEAPMTTASSPRWYSPVTVNPDAQTYWEAGSLQAWALHSLHEWRLATVRQEEKAAIRTSPDEPLPDRPSWKRWAFSDENAEISAVPAMPDKPLVVRPDSPIRIPRGNQVTFFVSVPIWLRFYVGTGKKRVMLTEEPTVVLSKTWFGDPTIGELCYALRTGASRTLDGIKLGAHRCVCPILIKNSSDHELDFEKLCIRTPHVNIFQGDTRLWSEEIRVSFRGKDQGSEISFSSSPPSFERVGEKAGEAREIAPKSFIRRSFDSLMML